MSPVLRGVGVTHRFGSTTVLRDADIVVLPGEMVAVTGPSGSGKSTLLHCLAGILAPAEGEVWLGADRIDGWTESRRTALRGSRLGFVFQFGQLLPELPAVENVALPLMLGGMRRTEAVARAAAWFAPLGLDGLEDRRPGQLSGGQEQRVAIARALVTSPEVVFADEPTGALDSETGQRIMDLLRELVGRTGTGLVVVTHDAEVAARCHRTVALRDGRTGAGASRRGDTAATHAAGGAPPPGGGRRRAGGSPGGASGGAVSPRCDRRRPSSRWAMMRTAALALRLLRLGGRRAALSAGLVGIGVLVGTMLLALALGGVHGWDAREERIGWRADLAITSGEPVDDPVARAASRTENGVEIVDLAVSRSDVAPPPGLPRVPAPGERWVSPALAALEPAATGVIDAAGLRGPDELVAVVGVETLPDGVGLASFGPSGGFGLIEIYRQLTYVAAALLVFPVASLLGASARLTAARRTERLALLRLLGASTRQVTVAAVTEVTAVATAAAALGVAAYWLAAPAVARIELGGGQWFADDVRPAPLTLLGIVAGVALLATGAAVGGMRQVVVGPLGVARRQHQGGARLLRLVGVVVGIAAFGIVNTVRQNGPANVTGLVFGVAVLIMFGTVSLLGPLVVRMLGASMTRSARSPATLLAGRRLLDDPKGAFRPLAGLTLAVFVAGFLAPLTPALAADSTAADLNLVTDLQRGTIVVLVGTFLIAATATGTAAAARILDYRRSLRLLRLAGTPLAVLDAARRAETTLPLLVLGGIGLAMGLLCASPFAAAGDAFAPSGLLVLGVVALGGTALVAAASAASRPLLREVTTEAARTD